MRKIHFTPGGVYHIFNRGVEKRDIFCDDNDRWRFLQCLFLFNNIENISNVLWQLKKRRGQVNFRVIKDLYVQIPDNRTPLVSILADCLMPNHFHLMVRELEENGVTMFMHKLGGAYTKYFNNKYQRVGSLLQGPFQAVPIESDVAIHYVLFYINVLNPIQLIEPEVKKDGLQDMEKALAFVQRYPWSTHQEYLGERHSHLIDNGGIFPTPDAYREFIRTALETKKYRSVSHLSFEE